MHQAARKILETYISSGKIPSPSELGLATNPFAAGKDPVFVTLYKDGRIIASSGRIHITKPSTATELIENTLLCLKDLRLKDALKSTDDLAKVQIRVDILVNGKRQIIKNTSEIDPKKDGVIFLSQGLGKLSVILPNITNLAENGDDFFKIACKKAGVDEKTLQPTDYVLYKFQTEVSTDLV